MDASVELVSFVTRAENRVEVLGALADGPATRRELQDMTGIPRATLSRILADFHDRDLVDREGHDYVTTLLGEALAAELQSLFDTVAGMDTIQTLHEWLDVDEYDIPLEQLTDAEVILPTPADPMAPIRRAEERLANGERTRVAGRGIVPSCLEAVWRAVIEGRQSHEAVVTPAALETISADSEMRQQTLDLFDAEDATVWVHQDLDLPFLMVVDDLIWIVVTDDDGTIKGHVETTDERVRAWAVETIDDFIGASDSITPELLTT